MRIKWLICSRICPEGSEVSSVNVFGGAGGGGGDDDGGDFGNSLLNGPFDRPSSEPSSLYSFCNCRFVTLLQAFPLQQQNRNWKEQEVKCCGKFFSFSITKNL